MDRRTFLRTAAASGVVAVAGCLGSETAVDETVEEETVFPFDADADQSIEFRIQNVSGTTAAGAILRGLDAESVATLETTAEETASVDDLQGGTYHAVVLPDEEASVRVTLEG